ncbi:hypothetical protein QEN19_003012 [Hanseniaspora menglaensis]
MQSIRELSDSFSEESFVKSEGNAKRDMANGQQYSNKIKRNMSYSSSIIQTPVLPNNNHYFFANIADNKNNVNSTSNNLNDFMMSRERSVKRDYSYRSSIRRKKTTTTDYLQNKKIETANINTTNRQSFYSRNDIARRPTLDPHYSSANRNSPNPNSIISSENGSIKNSNYVHSGSSNRNSFAIRQEHISYPNKELDLNKLSEKVSMSSLATGSASIAQVSVFRTSQTDNGLNDFKDIKKIESSTSSLNIRKIRNKSPLSNRVYSRNTNKESSYQEVKRVISLQKKSKKVLSPDKKSTTFLQKFEIYLAKIGKFTRRQIIKLKLMLKNAILKSDMLNENATSSLKQLSRTASSLIYDSRRKGPSNRSISRRITSSLNSDFDPNNTFYNNIMKSENNSRSNSVRRSLSIKMHDLISQRHKSLNLKYEPEQEDKYPSKSISLRRSPSSLKRAVSTIKTNKFIDHNENKYENSTIHSQNLERGTEIHRHNNQFGSVKLTSLDLEPLHEYTSGDENLTIKSKNISSHSTAFQNNKESDESSVYQDALEYTEQDLSLFSYYNTTANNQDKLSTVNNSVIYKGINHKPSNIRVISGGFNEIDNESLLSFKQNSSYNDFSYDQTKIINDVSNDKQILLEFDETEEEEGEEECGQLNSSKNIEELSELLNDFLIDIIFKKVQLLIRMSKMQALAELEQPTEIAVKKKFEMSKSNSSLYKSSRIVTRSFSLPIGFR